MTNLQAQLQRMYARPCHHPRDKTYDGWMDVREIWQECDVNPYFGGRIADVVGLMELWWQSNPNPHGWNISTRAKYAKGFKR